LNWQAIVWVHYRVQRNEDKEDAAAQVKKEQCLRAELKAAATAALCGWMEAPITHGDGQSHFASGGFQEKKE
jgi:hypothetical protein